ncbi:MAG: adenosylcobalamin-dependent ribonucleoside-diphosphate reductase [Methylococcales bacterium]|nr:adenosylcobalamin-dependent ribonucleoside-diphosphate reductase [Methylococcales bacterium]
MNKIKSIHKIKSIDLLPISQKTLLQKYASSSEKDEQAIQKRVAKALAKNEKDSQKWEKLFFKTQQQGFIPGGRVNAAAGRDLKSTLINCFVVSVQDTMSGFIDGQPGITEALKMSAETMRRGGGVGYNFSNLRPEGALIKGTGSEASGPISYMKVFDQMCETVKSAGNRRGAQMGILNVDHPDVLKFIKAKREKGILTNFNLSVAITDEFMKCLKKEKSFHLRHDVKSQDSSVQLPDGKWVYRTVDPKEIWDAIMQSTYDYAEPGVLYIDSINQNNNLWYVETIEATNPCAELPIPANGCCCLGSINLTKFISDPFEDNSSFLYEDYKDVIKTSIRMLDNVLDESLFPLEEQKQESINKRRIGLGFTGLHNAMMMLGIQYNSKEGNKFAESISRVLRDNSYEASIDLAKEKGEFPLFDKTKYGESQFVKNLPDELQQKIAKYGIRNSHLLSIAPTGTISFTFGNNCSSGIEPVFGWEYTRNIKETDNSFKPYKVQDYAYRLYQEMGYSTDELPPIFVTSLEMTAQDHLNMIATVAPFIDSSISKTVNVPVDYPFDDFKALYTKAYEMGIKGLTTYRPNDVTGEILVSSNDTNNPQDIDQSDPDRRIKLGNIPSPALASLRWPSRPELPEGNPSWTYMIDNENYHFSVQIGHVENGHQHAFEVWVNGAEQPRGLGALAKTLSMDMRCFDPKWMQLKLESLEKLPGEAFEMQLPGEGKKMVASEVAGFAKLIQHRLQNLNQIDKGSSPMIDAMMSRKEPKSGTNGTMAWTVDIKNPATGDDFLLVVKELELPNGKRMPFSIWVTGDVPNSYHALMKVLSMDMRIIDSAWIGTKLKKLLNFPEAKGDFLAHTPGCDKQANYASTIAYVARLLIHRYEMLGILDSDGTPVKKMGFFEEPGIVNKKKSTVIPGARCVECNSKSVIRRDGCGFCTACSAVGSCG